MTTQTSTRDQHYVFTGPDGWAWVESWRGDWHATAPSPRQSVSDQMAWLQATYPDAIVDEITDPADIADAMRYAL